MSSQTNTCMSALFISPILPIPQRSTSVTIQPMPNTKIPQSSRTRRSTMPITAVSNQQSAKWSPARFLRTILWYGPLGALAGRPAAAPVARQPPTATAPVAASTRTATGKSAPSARSNYKVLVTGAAGGVGRRVVAALVEDGIRVRALVRSRDAAIKAFQNVGIPETALNDGSVEIALADLYNLQPQLLDGINGVIGCTGTRIGPPGDTPDRAMYYQGTKFFTPTVLDDTPENVEFNGVKELVTLIGDNLKVDVGSNTDSVADTANVQPIFEFNKPNDVNATWGILDDVVMGGASNSRIEAKDGVLVFSGNVTSANNGGFASTRTRDADNQLNLTSYDGIQLRVRGDGRRYKVIIRDERRWDGVGHSASFDTVPDTFIDVRVPWNEFRAVAREKSVQTKLDPSRVVAAQLMFSKFEYDGDLNPTYEDGQFQLEVAQFAVYRKTQETQSLPTPFVHCSSSGVTRILRRSEFKEEDLPPAVRLNEQVGRVVEWKLAAEDVIRSELANTGYLIVRPTALTLEKPLGQNSLRLDQGDNMTGQVTRDDIARFMVDALFDSRLTNTTIEVAQNSSEQQNALNQQLDNLARDSDAESRTFGPFPFIPV